MDMPQVNEFDQAYLDYITHGVGFFQLQMAELSKDDVAALMNSNPWPTLFRYDPAKPGGDQTAYMCYRSDSDAELKSITLAHTPNPIPAGANWTAAASTALFGEPKHAPSRCDWDKAVMTSDVPGIRREECRVRHEMAADLAEPKPEPVKAQTRGLFAVAPMDHKFGGWGAK